jgi:hypothetical protein
VSSEAASEVERAKDDPFVAGLRMVMPIAAGLAIVNVLTAAGLIEGKGQGEKREGSTAPERDTSVPALESARGRI